MSSSRCPAIIAERPSLPGIHDLFGEHLALPIRQSSPFTLNTLSSTLPSKTSRTYYDYEPRETNCTQSLSPSMNHSQQRARGTKELIYPNICAVQQSLSRIHTQRQTSSQHYTSMDYDNPSPPSTGSSDEHFEPHLQTERKKLPAKYECEYCGKFFNRPSSLKIHYNTHTGQKPFACVFPGCGRSFSVMSNMRRHARTHGDSAVLSAREQSDSELSGIQLTPVSGLLPSPSAPNYRDSSRSATPLPYQTSKVPSRMVPVSRMRSGSISSDSSI